jgi:hypothetical protein
MISMRILAPNGGHTIAAINGAATFILSATTVESPGMAAGFDTSSGFRIVDPLPFAERVAREIPGFYGGIQGLCMYTDAPIIQKKTETLFQPPTSEADAERWAAEYDQWAGSESLDAFFVKRLKYFNEGEYRFIWFGSGREVDELYIQVPEARQFCVPLTDSDPSMPWSLVVSDADQPPEMG